MLKTLDLCDALLPVAICKLPPYVVCQVLRVLDTMSRVVCKVSWTACYWAEIFSGDDLFMYYPEPKILIPKA